MNRYLIVRNTLILTIVALANGNSVLGMEPTTPVQRLQRAIRDFDSGSLTDAAARDIGSTITLLSPTIVEREMGDTRQRIIENAQALVNKRELDKKKLANAIAGIQLIYESSQLRQQDELNTLIRKLRDLQHTDLQTGQPYSAPTVKKQLTGDQRKILEIMRHFEEGHLEAGLANEGSTILGRVPETERKNYLNMYRDRILDAAEAVAENENSSVRELVNAIAGLDFISGGIPMAQAVETIDPLREEFMGRLKALEQEAQARQTASVTTPVIEGLSGGPSGLPLGFPPRDILQEEAKKLELPGITPTDRTRPSYSAGKTGAIAAAVSAIVGALLYHSLKQEETQKAKINQQPT